MPRDRLSGKAEKELVLSSTHQMLSECMLCARQCLELEVEC